MTSHTESLDLQAREEGSKSQLHKDNVSLWVTMCKICAPAGLFILSQMSSGVYKPVLQSRVSSGVSAQKKKKKAAVDSRL